jgi:hypothetical protein
MKDSVEYIVFIMAGNYMPGTWLVHASNVSGPECLKYSAVKENIYSAQRCVSCSRCLALYAEPLLLNIRFWVKKALRRGPILSARRSVLNKVHKV